MHKKWTWIIDSSLDLGIGFNFAMLQEPASLLAVCHSVTLVCPWFSLTIILVSLELSHK